VVNRKVLALLNVALPAELAAASVRYLE